MIEEIDWLLLWKVALATLTGVLGLVVTFVDLRKEKGQETRPLTTWGKAVAVGLFFAVVLSIAVEFGGAAAERRAAREATLQLTRTADNAAEAARAAGIAADTARVAADSAKQASERTEQSAKVLGAVVEGVQEVMGEVERTARPLERVTLKLIFALPMTEPTLSGYKSRLDKGLQEYRALPDDVRGAQANIQMFGWGSPTWMPVRVYAGHPLFPQRESEKVAHHVLSIREVELAFYKTPVRPEQFRVAPLSYTYTAGRPKRLEPDLAVTEVHDRVRPVWPWVLINARFAGNPEARRNPGDVLTGGWEKYLLESAELSLPKSTWRSSSTAPIGFEKDLAGSQLMINIGGSLDADAQPLVAAFELTEVVLRINDKKVAITPETVTKHISEKKYPFWEFRFPRDPKLVFTSG